MSLTESTLGVGDLLAKLTEACAGSAIALDQQMRSGGDQMPARYVIPSMEVELKLEMSYTQGEIRGLLTKQTDESRATSLSTIRMSIVAVPAGE